MATDWRELGAAERERELSPSSCIGGDYQPFIAAYAQRSAAARSHLPHQTWRYGDAAAQQLDLFLPAPTAVPAPLLLFIHGGYWQELSKQESAFAAEQAVAQGLAFAALGYTLAPQASVAEIVAECRQALAWLSEHAARLGFDGGRIVLAGSSAGAHLAAMAALPGAAAMVALPGAAAMAALPGAAAMAALPGAGPRVAGVVLVSGLYELEPLVGTSINTALGLTPAAAQAVSPALLELAGFPPSAVCWGGIETAEFKRQGRDFAQRLQQVNTPCKVFEVPQRNHFDVILDLADAATELGRVTLALLRQH